jgi:hypothetical protein
VANNQQKPLARFTLSLFKAEAMSNDTRKIVLEWLDDLRKEVDVHWMELSPRFTSRLWRM